MKKMNNKGFTLIELLAVIVILAVVMVVTIPSVLNSMDSAREQQFKNAVETIRDYVQKNYDLCSIASDLSGTTYDTSLFNTNACTIKSDVNLAAKAGYSTSDISTATGTITNDKFTVTKACPAATGKFKGAAAVGTCS